MQALPLRYTPRGFTLIELMITVAVVGIMAAIALPSYQSYMQKAGYGEGAARLVAMGDQIRQYHAKYGRYPNDSHIVEPPGVDMPDYWQQATPLGGSWNWEGPDRYTYAGIAILDHTADADELAMFDAIIDDGDMDTGMFRWGSNRRPVYIIEDNI